MFKTVKKLMTHDEVKAAYALPEFAVKAKKDLDTAIKSILSGTDPRKIFIIGPCSADNEDSVCDYARRLKKLQQKVESKLLLIPRVYTNKPRTRGEGYKGMLHSPRPDKGTDIQGGIIAIRKMHLRIINETGMFGADEMLYPENYNYLDDVLSYVAIGARSSENQQHRLVASGIDVPVGVKNSMNGSLNVLLNSIYAAQIPNEFQYNGRHVKTDGNKFAHAVLRGLVDAFGNNHQNYHYEDIINFYKDYIAQKLHNPAVIIDANHSNSCKDALRQPRIVAEVVSNCKADKDFNALVKGFMVESYIEDGAQSPAGGVYGKSITDSCLGIEKTERLLLDTANAL